MIAAKDGHTLYLPFDFSDQYTGSIRCKFTADQVLMTPGSSSYFLTWDLTEVEKYALNNTDFSPDTVNKFSIARSELIQMINRSIQLMAAQPRAQADAGNGGPRGLP